MPLFVGAALERSMTTENFEFPSGVRWKCVGTGRAWPEGTTTIYIEWENGEEASFTTIHPDASAFADKWSSENEWAEDDSDPQWCDDPLPEFITSVEWTR
jgi:hypothetical protein